MKIFVRCGLKAQTVRRDYKQGNISLDQKKRKCIFKKYKNTFLLHILMKLTRRTKSTDAFRYFTSGTEKVSNVHFKEK